MSSISTHRVNTMVRRIFRQIRRDRPTLALLILAPLLITVLWSFILSGTVTGVSTAVCIQDAPIEDSYGIEISSQLEDNANVTAISKQTTVRMSPTAATMGIVTLSGSSPRA